MSKFGASPTKGLNTDTQSQRHMLQNAASQVKDQKRSFLQPILIPSPEKKLEQVLKEQSPRTLVSKIPITQFKSN